MKRKLLLLSLTLAVVFGYLKFRPGFYYNSCLYRKDFYFQKPDEKCDIAPELYETSKGVFFEFAENCTDPELAENTCKGTHISTEAVSGDKKMSFSFEYPGDFNFYPVINYRQGVWLTDHQGHRLGTEYGKDWQKEIMIYYDKFEEQENPGLDLPDYDKFRAQNKFVIPQEPKVYTDGLRLQENEKIIEKLEAKINGGIFTNKPALLLETELSIGDQKINSYYFIVDINVDGEKFMFFFKFSKNIPVETISEIFETFSVELV